MTVYVYSAHRGACVCGPDLLYRVTTQIRVRISSVRQAGEGPARAASVAPGGTGRQRTPPRTPGRGAVPASAPAEQELPAVSRLSVLLRPDTFPAATGLCFSQIPAPDHPQQCLTLHFFVPALTSPPRVLLTWFLWSQCLLWC